MARNSGKRFAKHTLRGAAAIDVGRVEKIDPKIECLVDASERLTLFNAARIVLLCHKRNRVAGRRGVD